MIPQHRKTYDIFSLTASVGLANQILGLAIQHIKCELGDRNLDNPQPRTFSLPRRSATLHRLFALAKRALEEICNQSLQSRLQSIVGPTRQQALMQL